MCQAHVPRLYEVWEHLPWTFSRSFGKKSRQIRVIVKPVNLALVSIPEPFFFNGRSSELYVVLSSAEAERFEAFAKAKNTSVKIEKNELSMRSWRTTENALVEFPSEMSLLAVEMLLAEFVLEKKEALPPQ